MREKDVTRREFLQTSAGATGALAASSGILMAADRASLPPEPVAPSDRVRFGIIGIGMQGSGLLGTSIQLPGVQCVAACDLYDGRHTLAREIVGSPIPVTRRYQELLDNKDIDCIVAAVPDHWHKQIVVDAVSAGKDIYCEKPMSHSVADGLAMVAAQQKTGRIVQIGSQRVSSVVCAKAKELLAQGIVGKVGLIEGSLGRNDPTGAWVYPPPPDLSPKTLDWDTWQGDVPKRPFDANIFARWRCWKEYGTGLAGDLLVHLVSGMQFMLGINEPPKRAMSMGGIVRFADGRNMPDVHCTLLEYGSIPVYFRLSLLADTPEIYRFHGPKGILEVTEFAVTHLAQTGEDTAPSYYTSGYPKEMREAYVKQWHKEHDPVPGKEATLQGVSIKSTSWDDEPPHLWTYFQAVKTRKPVTEDAVFGHNAALACHMANESYFRRAGVTWDTVSQQIRA